MDTILGVNGIRSTGVNTTDVLGAELQGIGYNFIDVNQTIRSAREARSMAQEDAMAIIAQANDGDCLIAHSYGCLKSSIAMRAIDFKAVFLIRPAMNQWHKFPLYHDTKIFCIHSWGDYTVLGGSMLLWHPFGAAGVLGFRSKRVANTRYTGAHSDDFHKDNVGKLRDFVDAALKEINSTSEPGFV